MWFDSRRSTVLARNGMVATSQPLAAAVGLRVLMDGGNAVDAAVATAAALTVLEPVSTGPGGDLFALIWMDREKRIRALNGSGRASAEASIEQLRKQGLSQIPPLSPYGISVPGVVDGWHALLQTYGTMPLSHLMAPAIRYAEAGFPVTEVIATLWDAATPQLSQYPYGRELLPNGRAPKEGEVVKLPELGATLRTIAEGGPDAFYRGELARKIADFVQEHGGWLSAKDMESHTSTWEEPIATNYRDATCWQCAPNGSGLAVLLALNIAENFELRKMGPQSAKTYHHLIESMRQAYADALHYVADPSQVSVPVSALLTKEYAKERARLINPTKSLENVSFGRPNLGSDTVYISVVDGQGNACSFINSVFEGFGTGLVVPGTGIALHNRASLFSLDPDHPNALAPGKRPYHTIIPGMVTRNDELWLCYGVMGAFQQPQAQLQVLVNMIDFDMDPQESLNALRFSVQRGGDVAVEEDLPLATFQQLQLMGHKLVSIKGHQRVIFGGGQVIERDSESGLLRGGSEPRKDGCAIGW